MTPQKKVLSLNPYTHTSEVSHGPLALTKLYHWFEQQGRHDLPWQHPRTPYRVWISEIMLQQTTVSTVIPYFERFMKAFPDRSSLARASLDEVLTLWTGLGYYARARNLHAAAQLLHTQYSPLSTTVEQWPTTVEQWQLLPGIGASTAGAIISQAFSLPAVVLDANVKRVFQRFYGLLNNNNDNNDHNNNHPLLPPPLIKNALLEKTLWALANANLPDPQHAINHTQALMNIGAMICTAKNPQCASCPFEQECSSAHSPSLSSSPSPSSSSLSSSHSEKSTPLITKSPKLIKKLYLLLIFNEEKTHILLEKRPARGIWGGLWSFIEASTKKECFDKTRRTERKRGKTQNWVFYAPGRHVFSHYTLVYTPACLILSREEQKKQSLWRGHNTQAWIAVDNLHSVATHGLLKNLILNCLSQCDEKE